MSEPKLHSERTTLGAWLAAGSVFVAGIGSLVVSNYLDSCPKTQVVCRELGGLLIATVAISILWTLAVRRKFLSELMVRARLAQEVRNAGILRVVDDYNNLDWDDLFKNAKEVDLFFAYASTWRALHHKRLEELSARNAKVRVVLPDPGHGETAAELGRRFGKDQTKVVSLIEEAASSFEDIFGKGPSDRFSLTYVAICPVFCVYRFDHQAVFTMYKHERARGPVPAFLAEEGGSLYGFLKGEFEALLDSGGSNANR